MGISGEQWRTMVKSWEEWRIVENRGEPWETVGKSRGQCATSSKIPYIVKIAPKIQNHLKSRIVSKEFRNTCNLGVSLQKLFRKGKTSSPKPMRKRFRKKEKK